MAHTIPDQILDFDKASREDVIFNAMKNGLGDDYWVFHSLGVNQTSTNGVFYEKEIDFVVYHREKGFFVSAAAGRDELNCSILVYPLVAVKCRPCLWAFNFFIRNCKTSAYRSGKRPVCPLSVNRAVMRDA